MSPKRAIVNLVNNDGYLSGQTRLKENIITRFDGTFIANYGEEAVGAPLHSDNPYAFKIYALFPITKLPVCAAEKPAGDFVNHILFIGSNS